MAFIKEETEDMIISEPFRVKHEDTEEQKGWFSNVNSETIFHFKMLTCKQIIDHFQKSSKSTIWTYEELLKNMNNQVMSATIKAD